MPSNAMVIAKNKPYFLKYLTFSINFLLGAILCCSARPAVTASSSPGGELFATYMTNFYVLHGTNGWFKKTQTNGVADFWELAEEIETVIDAGEAACPGADSALISQFLNGLTWKNGANWTVPMTAGWSPIS
jgi:hypothetical protein